MKSNARWVQLCSTITEGVTAPRTLCQEEAYCWFSSKGTGQPHSRVKSQLGATRLLWVHCAAPWASVQQPQLHPVQHWAQMSTAGLGDASPAGTFPGATLGAPCFTALL